MISSPVERIATVGRRTTSTSPRPMAARTPVSREVSRVPRLRTSSPRRHVGPGEGDRPTPARRGGARAVRRRRSPRARPSRRRRPLAGVIPPVAIGVAVPGPTTWRGTTPVASSSPLSRNRLGDSSAAPKVSSARSAKPSTFERSNAGTSTSVITSLASTRPRLVASATRSASSTRGRIASSHRRSAVSRSTTSRNWSCSRATRVLTRRSRALVIRSCRRARR